MTVTVQSVGEPTMIHRFALRAMDDAAEAAALAPLRMDGRSLYAFGLPPEEAHQLVNVRAAVLARRSAGKHGSLSIGINPDTCGTSELLPGPVLIDSYLRASELSDYVALTRNMDLRHVGGNDVTTLIPSCDASAT